MKKILLILLLAACIQANPKKSYLEENSKIQINIQVLQAAATALVKGLTTSSTTGTVEVNESFSSSSEELYGYSTEGQISIKKSDGTKLVAGTDYTYGSNITFYDSGSCTTSLASGKYVKICVNGINITELGITNIVAKDLSNIVYPMSASTAHYDPARNIIVMPGAITWYDYTGHYGKGNKIKSGLDLVDASGNYSSASYTTYQEVTSPILGYEFQAVSGGNISDTYSYSYTSISVDTLTNFLANSSYTVVLVYSKTLKTLLNFTIADTFSTYDGFKINQTETNSQQVFCNGVAVGASTIAGTSYDTNNNGTPNKTILYYSVSGSNYDLSSLGGAGYTISGTKTSCGANINNTPRVIILQAGGGTSVGTQPYYFKGSVKLYPFHVDKAWIQAKYVKSTTYDFSSMLPQYCALTNCALNKFTNSTIRYYK